MQEDEQRYRPIARVAAAAANSRFAVQQTVVLERWSSRERL